MWKLIYRTNYVLICNSVQKFKLFYNYFHFYLSCRDQILDFFSNSTPFYYSLDNFILTSSTKFNTQVILIDGKRRSITLPRRMALKLLNSADINIVKVFLNMQLGIKPVKGFARVMSLV